MRRGAQITVAALVIAWAGAASGADTYDWGSIAVTGVLTPSNLCTSDGILINCSTSTINLASQVTGYLAVTNGGTGANTAAAAVSNLLSSPASGTYQLSCTGTGCTTVAVPSGTQYQFAYYATTGSAISGNANITTNATNDLIVASGKIAVGTTSPYSPLTLQVSQNNLVPSLMITDGTISWGMITGTGPDAQIGTITNDPVSILVGNVVTVTFSTDGKIGVGSFSPSNALDVNTGEGIRLAAGTPSSTSNALYNVGGTLYWNGAAIGAGSVGGSGTANYIPVFSGSNTLANSVLYQSSNFVGLGTTNPQFPLEIEKNDDVPYASLKIGELGYAEALYAGQVVDSYGYIGNGYYYNSGAWRTAGTASGNIRFGYDGDILFTADASLTANTNYIPTIRMRIDAGTGRVGIGTTSMGERFTVYTESEWAAIGGYSTYDGGTGIYGEGNTGASSGVYGYTSSTSNSAVGVYGRVGATSGQGYGIYGRTDSLTAGAQAIYGVAKGTTTMNYGVSGYAFGPGGVGMFGSADTGAAVGVRGDTASTTANAAGVYGYASATSGATYGVLAKNNSTTNGANAIYGASYGASGTTYGVHGYAHSASGYAGYFENDNGGAAGIFIGSVGIGTTTINAKVDVAGDINVSGGATNTYGYNHQNFGLVSGYASPVAGRLIFGDNSNWTFNFSRGTAAAPVDLMTITDKGLVGIGSTVPLGILDVLSSSSIFRMNATYGHWLFHNGSSTAYWALAPRNSGNFEIAYTSSDPGAGVVAAGASLIAITTSGLVGIGTTAPIAKFEVHNDSAITQGAFSTNSSTATDHPTLYLLRGRGTAASPTAVLSGDDLGRLRFAGQYDSTSGHFNTSSYVGAVAAGNFSGTSTPSDIVIYTTPSGSQTAQERMIITSLGYIGIGSVSPAATTTAAAQGVSNYINNFNDNTGILLRKASTGAGDYLAVEDASNNPVLYVKSSGNVGIGTTLPANRLDVYSGGIHIGSDTPSSTANALYAIGTSLYWNGSAIGTSGGGGSGTVNSGTQYQMAYYSATGTAVSGDANLATDANSNLKITVANQSTTLTDFTQALTKSGINIISSYATGAYSPGIFWSTSDSNPTLPKAGIWSQNTADGSVLLFGTSGSYSSGIDPTVSIDQAGRVGIGTITPAYQVSLGATGSKIGMYGDASHNASIELYNGSTGNINFQTTTAGSVGNFTFTSTGGNGFVGVGTDSPLYPLNVVATPSADADTRAAFVENYPYPSDALSSWRTSSAIFGNTWTSTSNGTNLQLVGVTGYSGYGGTSSISAVNGLLASADNESTGTVGSAFGVNSSVANNSTGTITAAYALYGKVENVGTINNAYGLYIDSVAGTNAWGVYENSTAANYFAGAVGIGTTSPSEALQVRRNDTGDVGALIGNTTSRMWLGSAGGKNYIESGNAAWSESALLGFTGYSGHAGTFWFNGNVGIGTTSPVSSLHVATGGLFSVTGTYGSGDTLPAGLTGAGTRALFYPQKASIRAGYVDGTQWNDSNIGGYSAAFGYGTIASGLYSMAWGYGGSATGYYSTASGLYTEASGKYASASGYWTKADAFADTAIGQYNVGGGTSASWVTTDPIFEIGIGASSGARANAMTVLKNGNVGIGTSTPANVLEVRAGGGQFNFNPSSVTSGYTTTFTMDDAGLKMGHNSSARDFELVTNSLARLTIGSDGKTSVGTTTVSGSLFNVYGGVSVGTAFVATSAPTDGMIVAGSVGIGTAAPANTLDVYGTGIHIQEGTPSSTANALYAVGTSLYWNGSVVGVGGSVAGSGTANYLAKFTDTATLGDSVLYESAGMIGVGTTSPGAIVDIQGNDTQALLNIVNRSSTAARYPGVAVYDYTGGYGGDSGLKLYTSRGTSASPVAVSSGDSLGFISSYGQYDTTPGHFGLGAQIVFKAAEAFSSAGYGTDITFQTVGTGATTPVTAMVVSSNRNVGIGTTAPVSALQVASGGLFSVTGTYGAGDALPSGLTGAGTRFFFYPQKAAFRTGYVDGTQWDDANIGPYSFATGYKTIASGTSSVALGYASTASGLYSVAMGHYTEATGARSVTMGLNTKANAYADVAIGRYNVGGGTSGSWVATEPLFEIGIGTATGYEANAVTVLKNGNVGIGTTSPVSSLQIATGGLFSVTGTYGSGDSLPSGLTGAGTRMFFYPQKSAFRAGSAGTQWDDANIGSHSIAFGQDTKASGARSVAMGYSTTAGGDRSTAMGNTTTASGDYSTSTGDHTTASGYRSTAMGYYSTASGIQSTALGDNTRANAYDEFVIGSYNVGGGTTGAWVATDPIFEIGIGTAGAAANAVTVLKNGNVGIGTTSPGHALDVYSATGAAGLYVATGTAGTYPGITIVSGNSDYNPYLGFVGNETNLASVWADIGGGSLGFSVNGSPRMVIGSSGNVGIGTMSPTSPLTLYVAPDNGIPSLGITNGTISWGLLTGTGPDAQIGTLTNHPVGIIVNNTPAAVFATNGMVGFGTTSPVNGLDVYANGIHLQSSVPSSTANALYANGSTLYWNGTALGGTGTVSGTANYIPVFTGTNGIGNSVMYQSSSSIGIGTTSPSTALQVNGVVTAGDSGSTTGSTILQGSYGSGALSVWGSERSSGAPVMAYGATPSNVTQGGFLSATSASSVRRAAVTVGGDNALVLSSGAAQTVAIGSALTMAPIVTISTSGQMGIGTSSWAGNNSRLDVASSGYVSISAVNTSNSVIAQLIAGTSAGWVQTSTNHPLYFTTNDVSPPQMMLATSGSVGIGTTNPWYTLDVRGQYLGVGINGTADTAVEVGESATGSHYAYIDLSGDTTYTDYGLRLVRGNGGANTSSQLLHRGTGDLRFITQEAAPITFQTSAAERVRIASGGNVGIGSTSPAASLDVLSSATTGNAIAVAGNSVTTGNVISAASGSLTSGAVANISSTSTAGIASGSSYVEYISRSGANANGTHTAYGLYSTVTNTGTNSTNVAGYFNASGGTTNIGLMVPTGAVAIGTTTSSGTVNVVSYSAATNALNIAANSLTTGAASYVASSSTAGGASGSSYLQRLVRSGANTNGTHTAYGLHSTVTNTGTNGTNVAGYFSASGGTSNYGLLVPDGSVVIGTTSSTSGDLVIRKKASGAGEVLIYAQHDNGNKALEIGSDLNRFTYLNLAYNGTTTVQLDSYHGSIINPTSYSTLGGLTIGGTGTSTGFGLYVSGPSANGAAYFNGNVGIGSTSPANALDVNTGGVHLGNGAPSSTANALYAIGTSLYWNGSAVGGGSGSGTVNSGTQYQMAYYSATGTAVSGTSYITTDASNNLIVPSTKVGIGTNSPSFALDVASPDSAPYAQMRLSNTGYSQAVFAGQVVNSYGYIGSGYYYDGSNWRSPTTTASDILFVNNGSIWFTTNSGLTANTNYTPTLAMMISSNGNVGIGTTDPGAVRLWIDGSTAHEDAMVRVEGNGDVVLGLEGSLFFDDSYSYASGTYIGPYSDTSGNYDLSTLKFTTGGVERMRIGSTGYVGIGTTSPGRPLTIDDTSTQIGLRIQATGSQARSIELYSADSSRHNFLIGANLNLANTFEITPATALGSTTYTNAALVVNSSGNVGIGAGSPDAVLSVKSPSQNAVVNVYGVSASTDYGVIQVSNVGGLTNPSSRALILQPNAGYVGIGTTSPTATLDVLSTATTGNGVAVVGNSMTTGAVSSLASTSTAGGASGASYVQKLARSGANANGTHSAYGLYSTVTNTGTNSKNIAGYFAASGGTSNYGLLVPSGYVGIGTTAPGNNLEVNGGLSIIGDAASTSSNGVHIYFASDTGIIRSLQNGVAWRQLSIDGSPVSFNSTSVGNVIFNPNGGYVGIGSTSPQGPLDILSNSSIVRVNKDYGHILVRNSTATGAYWAVAPRSTGSFDIAYSSTDPGTGYIGTTGSYLSISSSGNINIGTQSGAQLVTTYDTAAKTVSYTSVYHYAGNTSSTASVNKIALQIESSGTWNGTSAMNTGLRVNVAGGTSNYAATFLGGNVGIGTTRPANGLDIASTEGIHIAAGTPTSTSAALYNVGGTLYWNGTALGSGSGTINSGTQYQMAYYAATGTAVSGHSAITTDASSNLLVTTGSVGIGTTAPKATLDVSGYAKLKLNSSAPVTCSATYQGSLALTHLARLCVCDTTNVWSDVVKGTACAW